MPEMPDFPEFIDSSMLSTYKGCKRKFLFSYMHHLKPHDPSVHLHAGKAVASGLEAARRAFYADGLSQDEAEVIGACAFIKEWGDYQAPEGKKKQFDVMLGAMMHYFKRYPFASDVLQPYRFEDNRPAVEFTFAIPLDVTHPATGQPILYVGRLDLVGVHRSTDFIYAVDEKTTEAFGVSWPNQWYLRGQFIGYTWALRQSGIPAKGAWVRGIGIMANEFKFEEVLVDIPDWMMDEWYNGLIHELEDMKQRWLAGESAFIPDFSDACGSYSGCQFREACKTSPENREIELDFSFKREQWNPLADINDED